MDVKSGQKEAGGTDYECVTVIRTFTSIKFQVTRWKEVNTRSAATYEVQKAAEDVSRVY